MSIHALNIRFLYLGYFFKITGLSNLVLTKALFYRVILLYFGLFDSRILFLPPTIFEKKICLVFYQVLIISLGTCVAF